MDKFFIEIGAANFDTLLPLADAGWGGIVVEPIPKMVLELRKIYQSTSVRVIQGAVSDFDGEVDIAVARDDGSWLAGCSHIVSGNHLGYKLSTSPDREGDFEQTIKSKCFTLETLFKEVPSVDLLKVDAEGHELNIFMNYSFDVKPRMIKVEHKHVDDKILARKLELNGYLVWTEKDDIYAIS